MSTEVLSSVEALERIGPEWDDLARPLRNPLVLHDWQVAAARAFHASERLQIVVVRRAGQLAAAAPLVERIRGGVHRLEFIGSRVLGEPCALIARDAAAAANLGDWLSQCGKPLLFARMETDGAAATALAVTSAGRGWSRRPGGSQCLWVDTSGDWEQYISGRSAECRHGYQRKRRRLARLGEVRYEVRRPARAELSAVLSEAFEIEADGWKGRGGSAILARTAMKQFVEEMCLRFSSRNCLRVAFLRAGDQAVAMQIAIDYEDSLWEIKIGFREDCSYASPGKIILWETLRDCFQQGRRRYEFLGAGDPQQSDWVTGTRALQTFIHYPANPAGVAAMGMDFAERVRMRLQKALKRHP